MGSFSAGRRLGIDPDKFVSKEILWNRREVTETVLKMESLVGPIVARIQKTFSRILEPSKATR